MAASTSAPGMTLAECYAELGLERQASPDAVKRAYRRQLMRCHPDLNGGDHSRREQFERVQHAYRALESRRKGIRLHGPSRREHVEEAAALRAARMQEEAPLPPGERRFQNWRRYGFLATLSAAVVGGLLINRDAQGGARMPYGDLYLAAIAAGAASWGLILGMLAALRKNAKAERADDRARRRT